MATAAQHLTVGGLLHFDFLLACTPASLQIMSVSATLFAHYTLQSMQRPNNPPQFASKRTRLFLFDAKNPPCTDTTMLAKNGDGSLSPTMTSGSSAPSSPQSQTAPSDSYISASTSTPMSPSASKSRAISIYEPTQEPLQIIEVGGSY